MKLSYFELLCVMCTVSGTVRFTKDDIVMYRERARSMFYHAYDGYLRHAYPFDELRPLTCDGHDTWGGYSLSLVDALDTLAVIGNFSEFRRVAQLLVSTLSFDRDINVSVFETNIRVVGGLLSAHLMSKRAGSLVEPGWPCSGPLLRLAENAARRLLPAFNSSTGMPYGTVNLARGVPKGETPITCTAGVGTFLVEFGTLSRLTGDPVFERIATKATRALYSRKSQIGLVGNHINVETGEWTALDAGIGAGVDSYLEYLVKGAALFGAAEFKHMFDHHETAISTHLERNDWYLWANMNKGTISLPVFQSLEAFWPGLLSLVGKVEAGLKSLHNYHQVWKQFGFTPEFYNIPKNEVHTGREGYPLRPELIESVMYLYRSTKDPFLLEVAVDILESIEHNAKTLCGYATVKDVRNHRLDNRMESFFLAETTKYLYLVFDTDNFIHNTGGSGIVVATPHGECVVDAGGYVFNTEAHPIDPAALHCCTAHQDLDTLSEFHDSLDLLSLLGVTEPQTDMFSGVRWNKLARKHLFKGQPKNGPPLPDVTVEANTPTIMDSHHIDNGHGDSRESTAQEAVADKKITDLSQLDDAVDWMLKGLKDVITKIKSLRPKIPEVAIGDPGPSLSLDSLNSMLNEQNGESDSIDQQAITEKLREKLADALKSVQERKSVLEALEDKEVESSHADQTLVSMRPNLVEPLVDIMDTSETVDINAGKQFKPDTYVLTLVESGDIDDTSDTLNDGNLQPVVLDIVVSSGAESSDASTVKLQPEVLDSNDRTKTGSLDEGVSELRTHNLPEPLPETIGKGSCSNGADSTQELSQDKYSYPVDGSCNNGKMASQVLQTEVNSGHLDPQPEPDPEICMGEVGEDAEYEEEGTEDDVYVLSQGRLLTVSSVHPPLSYSLLTCRAQPFHSRFTIMGEFFQSEP